MRSLLDGRDMQISKVLKIVAALDLSLELRQASSMAAKSDLGDAPLSAVGTSGTDASDQISVPYHSNAPQPKPTHIFFDPGWLGLQGWNAQCLRWVVAPDASSAVCVTPGASCLLDCAQIWPGAQAVWAKLDEGALNVRYLSGPAPETLLISARDPARPIRHLTGPALDRITPLGRVLWTGTTLPGQP